MYACLSPAAIENAPVLFRPGTFDGISPSSDDEEKGDEEEEEDGEEEDEEELEEGDELEGIDSGIDDEDDEDDEGGACQLVTCRGVRVT